MTQLPDIPEEVTVPAVAGTGATRHTVRIPTIPAAGQRSATITGRSRHSHGAHGGLSIRPRLERQVAA